MKRLLFLGFSFPPGMHDRFPDVNPAGHAFETRMVAALRRHLEIRSVSLLSVRPEPPPATAPDPDSGVPHDLVLFEGRPELLRRLQALRRLQTTYRAWLRSGWQPDAVVAYNLSPVYNAFIRWLARAASGPRRVLLLLDSSQLGRPLPRLKRLRYRLKPMVVPDEAMLTEFDACIGLSPTVESFFRPRDIPFLWMPGGCSPDRAPPVSPDDSPCPEDEPIRFGYFGALATHAGVPQLLACFHASALRATLHVCGHGKLATEVADLARRDPRVRWHGLLPKPDDCLRLAQDWDVLVNPRPASHGNENCFPSKLFDYALCRRAVLTSRMSGTDAVLGPEAFYLDPAGLETGLREHLGRLAEFPRDELRRRGAAIHARVVANFSWAQQAAVISDFITRVSARRRT